MPISAFSTPLAKERYAWWTWSSTDPGLAVLTIDRPHARNAIALDTMEQLEKALDAAAGAPSPGDQGRRRSGVRIGRRPQGAERAADRGRRRGDGEADAVHLRSARRLPGSGDRRAERPRVRRRRGGRRGRRHPGGRRRHQDRLQSGGRSRSCRPGAAPSGWPRSSERAGRCCWRAPDSALDAAEAERIGLVDWCCPASSFDEGWRSVARSLARHPAAEIKRVISGVSPDEAIASFARLWVADAHWQAAERVMNRTASPRPAAGGAT